MFDFIPCFPCKQPVEIGKTPMQQSEDRASMLLVKIRKGGGSGGFRKDQDLKGKAGWGVLG